MSEVLAVKASEPLVLDTQAKQNLDKEVSIIERQAMAIDVSSDLGYSAAGSLLVQIKDMQKKIKEYWSPLKSATDKAHKDVVAREKEMLQPIAGAEIILKGKMGEYTKRQRQIAEELEARKRREAEEEAAKKLAEAAALENSGDNLGADYAMAEAEVYEQYANFVTVDVKKPKVQGVSTTKSWKIKSIDPNLVPTFFNGIELRPVDKAAVLRLVKASKGSIIIPGVEIEEDVVISARAQK